MDEARKIFTDNVQRIRQIWHEVNNASKDFERRATTNPMACADEALRKVAYEANLYRVTHERLFGLDLKRRQDWWGRAPMPPDPDRRALFIDCIVLYGPFAGTWELYRRAIKRPDLQGENLAHAMCEIYTETKLTEPYLLACSTESVSAQLPQKVRENACAEHLTGYFRTLLSTTLQYRLGRALRKVGSPSNSLVQELPIASLIAWAERGDEEFVLGRLKDRIANSIIAQASKAVVRPEKLQGTAAGAAPIEALSERYPGVGHR